MDQVLARCPHSKQNPMLGSHIKMLALWKESALSSTITPVSRRRLVDMDRYIKLEVSDIYIFHSSSITTDELCHKSQHSTMHNQWLEDRLVWKLWPKRTQSIWIPKSESHGEYLTMDTFPSLRDLSWSDHLLLQMIKFKKNS